MNLEKLIERSVVWDSKSNHFKASIGEIIRKRENGGELYLIIAPSYSEWRNEQGVHLRLLRLNTTLYTKATDLGGVKQLDTETLQLDKEYWESVNLKEA